ETALETLGVKAQTLYAYVSRGQIRAITDPEDPRRSLYARHDVERQVQKRQRPRRRADVAAGTISWGEPVLESSISTVRDGDLLFGNARAVDLAETFSLEEIAGHHWQYLYTDNVTECTVIPPRETAKARGVAWLAAEAAQAPPSIDRNGEALAREASRLLSGFADAMIGERGQGPIHLRLAQSWGLSGEVADLVRRALVLISDHELNASTFAVRVAISTGASLAAGVLAGFAALSGPLHGEASVVTRQHLQEALRHSNPEAAARFLLERPGATLGFGHPLYPEGDVRAKALFEQMTLPPELSELIARVEEITGRKANGDVAFAALTMLYRLSMEASATLFAVGRMTGWLAHAQEQQRSGQLIRPRARFVPPGRGSKRVLS
ncbi:MAG: citrate synthase, partial [Alphaproteobacteria bacterium]